MVTPAAIELEEVIRQALLTPPPGLYPRSEPHAARLEDVERELHEIRILLERIAEQLGVRSGKYSAAGGAGL